MNITKVDSSIILAYTYNSESYELEIQFTKAFFRYYEFKNIDYLRLTHTESVGKFFHSDIKNKFEYKKIDKFGGNIIE